jgi:hypothetical protein
MAVIQPSLLFFLNILDASALHNAQLQNKIHAQVADMRNCL